MIKKTIIDAKDARYISEIPEFKNELPKGILNKKKADVGGTFAALNYPTNYIVVVPSISLIESMKADKNVSHEIFDIKGGTSYKDFEIYVLSNKIHKIVITYNSFYKVIKWLNDLEIKTKDYKVLIDEFHILLESYLFRYKAIDSLINTLNNFDHITYMTATPIKDIFTPDFFKNQPVTTIEWNNTDKITILPFKHFKTSQIVLNIINEFLSKSGLYLDDINGHSTKVKELFIFVDSVKYIATIIKTLSLKSDTVKVVCSDNIKNIRRIKDAGVKISKVNDENKKINFFTSKSFEGCNLYSNNGLVIVVSDCSFKNTLINLDTTLIQIPGRLRLNKESQNIFRHIIIHVFNTGNDLYNYTDQSLVKFAKRNRDLINRNLKTSNDIISIYNKISTDERETYRKQIMDKTLYAVYNKEKDLYEISEMILKYNEYIYQLFSEMYYDPEMVIGSYSSNHFIYDGHKSIGSDNSINFVKLKLVAKINFKDLIKEYFVLRDQNDSSELIEKYESEYPFFNDAYEVLGYAGVSTCKFSQTNIKRHLNVYSPEVVDSVLDMIVNGLGNDNFICIKDLKSKAIQIYNEMDINIKGVGITTTKIIDYSIRYTFKNKNGNLDGKRVKGKIITLKPFNIVVYSNSLVSHI